MRTNSSLWHKSTDPFHLAKRAVTLGNSEGEHRVVVIEQACFACGEQIKPGETFWVRRGAPPRCLRCGKPEPPAEFTVVVLPERKPPQRRSAKTHFHYHDVNKDGNINR